MTSERTSMLANLPPWTRRIVIGIVAMNLAGYILIISLSAFAPIQRFEANSVNPTVDVENLGAAETSRLSPLHGLPPLKPAVPDSPGATKLRIQDPELYAQLFPDPDPLRVVIERMRKEGKDPGPTGRLAHEYADALERLWYEIERTRIVEREFYTLGAPYPDTNVDAELIDRWLFLIDERERRTAEVADFITSMPERMRKARVAANLPPDLDKTASHSTWDNIDWLDMVGRISEVRSTNARIERSLIRLLRDNFDAWEVDPTGEVVFDSLLTQQQWWQLVEEYENASTNAAHTRDKLRSEFRTDSAN